MLWNELRRFAYTMRWGDVSLNKNGWLDPAGRWCEFWRRRGHLTCAWLFWRSEGTIQLLKLTDRFCCHFCTLTYIKFLNLRVVDVGVAVASGAIRRRQTFDSRIAVWPPKLLTGPNKIPRICPDLSRERSERIILYPIIPETPTLARVGLGIETSLWLAIYGTA